MEAKTSRVPKNRQYRKSILNGCRNLFHARDHGDRPVTPSQASWKEVAV